MAGTISQEAYDALMDRAVALTAEAARLKTTLEIVKHAATIASTDPINMRATLDVIRERAAWALRHDEAKEAA